MNNIDGSYFAAAQFGRAREQRLQEQAKLQADAERYKKDVRRSWIQFWVPISISIVALGIAIASLILDIQK